MSFGSPSKLYSPLINQNSVKSYSNFSNNMPNHTSQIQLKPGTVSLGAMINHVALKTFTEFQQLIEVLPSKDDVDKKEEIAKFLRRTRTLLIRLQALNKWTPSAQKVDKCEKISNLLDEQSSFLMKTAEDLSILVRNRLHLARLHNFLPIISVDIFATKTYSRLPNQIKLSVLKSQRINKLDKTRMFNELDRILRIRLSNSKIPYRMRSISISNGRVTFTVPDEFVVTCTLMSDHFDYPWRLLNINFLVKGNNVCRGRSLVHNNHLKTMHEIIQIRLNSNLDNRPSLYHLYDMMHSMSVYLQLDVLREQVNAYVGHGHGIPIYDVRYVRGSKLMFFYWHRSEKYSQRPKHNICVTIDEEDPRRPLKVKHQPALCSDIQYTERFLDTSNLSIKNLISESIVSRIYSTLKMVQRLLFPFNDSNCVPGPNPVLLIPILSTDCKDSNYLKIQIHPSTGYVKTCFEMPFDFTNRFKENKINKILLELDTDINELLLKSFTASDVFDTKKILNIMENRDVITHRRNISNSMNRLRVILAKYECLSILQKAGFKDLHLFVNRPPICREKSFEKMNRNLIYDLFDQEAKGDCELLFIPINHEWNYFIVVACETKFRMVPNYRIYVLSTSKVFTVANTSPYSEKMWALRPVKMSPLSADIIKKINNIKIDPIQISGVVKRNLKRESITCSDLLHRIHAKQMKLDSGLPMGNDKSDEGCSEQLIILTLPSIIGYMKDNIIFKLLLHEIERRSIIFESERINEEIFVHSCEIKKFPDLKGCSKRATNLMNRMLTHCSVTYMARPQECDGTSHIKWEAELFMRTPFILFDKSLNTTELYSKRVVLCSKKCLEENRIGIKEAVEKLMLFWEEICQFGDCCLLPMLEKSKTVEEFKLGSYHFNELVFTYGNDHQYKVVVSYSISAGFSVSPEISDSHINKVTITNPHILIKKDLENYMNSRKNIVVLLRMLSDTLEFLANVYPFSYSTLMVMQDCSSTQLLKNYSLIVLDAYHVVLVFRERFALNIILNNETQTVQLSDAHRNFHACNMSIKEMPLFDKFMWSLEEAYRMNIEDEVWSGLFVDQLAALIGNHSSTNNRLSPTLLENYLLSALQMGAHEEVLWQIPSGKEGKLNTVPELQIELVSRDEKSTPFWELQIKVKRSESSLCEKPWLLENDMFILAKTVFESRIRAPKQSEIGLNMFKRLLQLPSFNLQHNLLKILAQPPTCFDHESKSFVAFIDLDWANFQEAISHPQEPSSIMLKFVVNVKICQAITNQLEKSVNLPLFVHYAAKSNQIAVLPGTYPLIQRQNLDKEANSLVVGKVNGDTPLLSFVNKLMCNVKEYLN